MEGEVSIAFTFCIETWEVFSGYDVALERADLPFVQELFAMRVFATDVSA